VDNAKLKRRVYCVGGFIATARQIADSVKKVLPKADIKFTPDAELDQIVRSWPRNIDESRAQQEWGWKTKFLLDDTVRDFVKEVQAHPEIYG
jgi:nucleoside-diphosphate-sugar epimerase